jgi:hypothetical protein
LVLSPFFELSRLRASIGDIQRLDRSRSMFSRRMIGEWITSPCGDQCIKRPNTVVETRIVIELLSSFLAISMMPNCCPFEIDQQLLFRSDCSDLYRVHVLMRSNLRRVARKDSNSAILVLQRDCIV